MDAQDTSQSQRARQQRKADREKRREMRREERSLKRQKRGERRSETEVVSFIEDISEHVFAFFDDILDVVRERRDKNRREGQVAPKKEPSPGRTA